MRYFTLILIIFGAINLNLKAQYDFIPAAPYPGPQENFGQDFDVLHYDLELDVTKAPLKETEGACSIRLVWTGDPDTSKFYFHLRSLQIDDAMYEDQPVTAVSVGDPEDYGHYYEIEPPIEGDPGDTVVITIKYSGEMTSEHPQLSFGGVSSSGTNLWGIGAAIIAPYVSAARHWMPCFDHPMDKATYTGRFITEKDFVAVSNGDMTSGEIDGDTKYYEWEMEYPVATYLLTFAVDYYIPVIIPDDDLEITVWSNPEDSAATAFAYSLVPEMVDAYSTRFGPYPFNKLGYVNLELRGGAMEHQAMISMPEIIAERLYFEQDSNNMIAAHELAHQWFGDLVSPMDFRDVWLNESFASFCEPLWFEHYKGWDAYLEDMRGEVDAYFRTADRGEIIPLYNFQEIGGTSNYPGTIYDKGAVVVGMLRHELGDEDFFDALRLYLERYEYGSVTTQALKEILEEVSGKDLTHFFGQWIYDLGFPEFDITVSLLEAGENNKVKVTIKQVQNENWRRFTDFPLELTIGNQALSKDYYLRITEAEQEFILEDAPPVFWNVAINQGDSVITLARVKNITGVSSEDVQFEGDVVIAPNPADNVVKIDFSQINGVEKVELYSVDGKVLCSREFGISNPGYCEFKTSEYESGAYFVNIWKNGNMISRKVIIEH